ncbi:WhiB family transcriptional regulator [Gordonia alkanivorans]|uniref:WhiB family transcriptional regulator n=1 Tax=Gordonia alkanivorans TaxID=84096 RepID=UPI0004BBCA9D|nr:WhiB family transcriptional regulator [Gordonia alkanivorans]
MTTILHPLHEPLSNLLSESHAPNWRGALCAEPGRNPEDWQPFPSQDYTQARQVCERCPLQTACLVYGRRNKLPGVWGGQRLG